MDFKFYKSSYSNYFNNTQALGKKLRQKVHIIRTHIIQILESNMDQKSLLVYKYLIYSWAEHIFSFLSAVSLSQQNWFDFSEVFFHIHLLVSFHKFQFVFLPIVWIQFRALLPCVCLAAYLYVVGNIYLRHCKL